ncbi:MAG: serine/threonine-protein kinase [candidate division Zixibacteria bacterium]|nr:serine/threonine-protein kinase [candidate division Zixibacteria bacterium]
MSPLASDSRFSDISLLGRGGTAEVSRAYVADLARFAAVKAPLTCAFPAIDLKALIDREWELIGGRRFPGLVRLLEKPDTEKPYLLLEMCHGPTLDSVGRVEDIAVAVNLLSAAVLSLEYLNASGIIHGDIKPHNFFLPSNWRECADNRFFYLKLSDFSLGRLVNESNSCRLGLGTLGYMAPETIVAGETSHRSDLFALGVMAYQMFTGVHPFMAEDNDPLVINSRVREQEPKPIKELRPDLPHGLVAFINRLLSKDSSQRPESAWQVCCELKKIGAHYPFENALRPSHLTRRTQKYSELIGSVLDISDEQRRRVDDITGGHSEKLRVLIASNFLCGNLKYDKGRFTFKQDVLWPNRLRKSELAAFSCLPLKAKKSVISYSARTPNTCYMPPVSTNLCSAYGLPPAFSEMLTQFLSPKSIKRLASKQAIRFEKQEQIELAGYTYLRAGKLEEADRCAYQAAIRLNGDLQPKRAMHLLRRVIEFAELTNNLKLIRGLLLVAGNISKENGEFAESMVMYERLIVLFESLPEEKLLADAHKSLGDLYRLKQDFAAGVQSLEKAIIIYEKLNLHLDISHVLNNLGNLYWINSDLPKALSHYRQALHIQRKAGADAEVASTVNNIAVMYFMRGSYGRAIRLFNLSLNMKKELGNMGEIARTLNNLGYIYHLSGDSGKAVVCVGESLELNRRTGNKKEVLINLATLTSMMICAGQLKQSLQYIKEGVELSESIDDLAHNASFQLDMAAVFRLMGRISEAEQALVRAERTLLSIDDPSLVFSAKIQKAEIRNCVGDGETAFDQAKKLTVEAQGRKDHLNEMNALLLITRLTNETIYVDRAMALTEDMKERRNRIRLVFNMLEYALEKNDMRMLPTIEPYIGEALTLPDSIEVSSICCSVAELKIAQGQPNEALPFLNRAKQIAVVSGVVFDLLRYSIIEGRLRLIEKDFEKSFGVFKKALMLAKKVSDSIVSPADRTIFQNKREIVYLAQEIGKLNRVVGKK